jgi:elongation factor P hydroxylase
MLQRKGSACSLLTATNDWKSRAIGYWYCNEGGCQKKMSNELKIKLNSRAFFCLFAANHRAVATPESLFAMLLRDWGGFEQTVQMQCIVRYVH